MTTLESGQRVSLELNRVCENEPIANALKLKNAEEAFARRDAMEAGFRQEDDDVPFFSN